MENQIIIPVSCLKALRLFSAKMDVRFYLCGIDVEVREGELTAVSTDGHRMAIFREKTDVQDCHFYLPNSIADIVIKNAGALGAVFIADAEKTTFKLFDTVNSELLIGKADHKFPNWRLVYPKDRTMTADSEGLYNLGYIADMVKAAKILGNRLPQITLNGDNKAGLFKIGGDFEIIIMPMRL